MLILPCFQKFIIGFIELSLSFSIDSYFLVYFNKSPIISTCRNFYFWTSSTTNAERFIRDEFYSTLCEIVFSIWSNLCYKAFWIYYSMILSLSCPSRNSFYCNFYNYNFLIVYSFFWLIYLYFSRSSSLWISNYSIFVYYFYVFILISLRFFYICYFLLSILWFTDLFSIFFTFPVAIPTKFCNSFS